MNKLTATVLYALLSEQAGGISYMFSKVVIDN